MKTPAIILFLASLFAVSCREAPMPPSDDEMIQNFITHEAAFNKLKEVVSEFRYSSCYPPYHSMDEQDSLFLKELSEADKLLLDSLLNVIGSERVRFTGREKWKEYYGLDTTETIIDLPYYAHGYSIGGTEKYFIHDPRARKGMTYPITEHGDLNEIYRRRYNDTILCKPIKGDWYIMLEHDN